jgi:uncharacterized protein involved in type VI secretion and phage assembly
MGDGLFDWVSDLSAPSAPHLNGVFLATVTDNLDLTGLGRVQLSIPALPDVQPWARVAAPFAGDGSGFYAIPQSGDEVLVAFEGGDVDHPYVIGALWSMGSQPPSDLPTDAVTKRIVKTPLGHTIELDDLEQTVTITTSTDQEITMGVDAIEITAGKGTSKVTIDTLGSITLQAVKDLSLKAPQISIDAAAQLKLSGASVSVQGTGSCTVQAPSVAIN